MLISSCKQRSDRQWLLHTAKSATNAVESHVDHPNDDIVVVGLSTEICGRALNSTETNGNPNADFRWIEGMSTMLS